MFRKPKILLNYPHFLPADTEIWTRFLIKHPDHFDSVDYDIHVGKGIAVDPAWEDNIARMATTITQRRIDVLGVRLKTWFIVEVKKDPGVSAVGQLIGYRILYKAKYPDRPTPRLLLIANQIDADLKTILLNQYISYFVV